ncbi:UPF0235 protein C15orf40 homolog isoform X2 [Parambassis ranga]|uniref:UPF0235 protein C15orf40 homolog isoform X2 n=1 Tax=Parambassis ranga TaxID=210632 RepID=A0A6P7KCL2_9TELE|nr:UPF0235 protein C15orf40 homolog isoform X2 [Parambassis ranga]
MFPRCVSCSQRVCSAGINLSGEFVPVLSRRLTALSRHRGPAVPAVSRQTGRYSRDGNMPRKEKTVRAGGQPAAAEPSGPVTRDKSGCVSVAVHAKPGSKHSSITGVSPDAVDVAIAAPPTDGEANAELIRFLAEVLDLKKSHISLDKGCRSRDKVIRVDSAMSPEEVLRKLREAAG